MPVVRTDGRSVVYGHVITKFSRMGRLPMVLRCARESSAMKLRLHTGIIYTISYTVTDICTVQNSNEYYTCRKNINVKTLRKLMNFSTNLERFDHYWSPNKNLKVWH